MIPTLLGRERPRRSLVFWPTSWRTTTGRSDPSTTPRTRWRSRSGSLSLRYLTWWVHMERRGRKRIEQSWLGLVQLLTAGDSINIFRLKKPSKRTFNIRLICDHLSYLLFPVRSEGEWSFHWISANKRKIEIKPSTCVLTKLNSLGSTWTKIMCFECPSISVRFPLWIMKKMKTTNWIYEFRSMKGLYLFVRSNWNGQDQFWLSSYFIQFGTQIVRWIS